MKRTMVLLAVLMAAMVVFSGPVAGVLDLPEPTAEAKKKHKKKKKKKDRPRPPAYNVVYCQPAAGSCDGTALNDYLAGSGESEFIQGGEGNDVYAGNGGQEDIYSDSSLTSNDFYTGFPNDQFGAEFISDRGGSSDTLDLRNFESTDFAFYAVDLDDDGVYDDLRILELNGNGDQIHVYDHFGASGRASKSAGHIENISFSDKTLSGDGLPEGTAPNLWQGAFANGHEEADDEGHGQRPAGAEEGES